MKDNLEIFRKEFLNANTWAQRKDGVPLDLLDGLNKDEQKIAAKELIQALSLSDIWPIRGVGYLKLTEALPKLYALLPQSEKGMKVTIAHSIFNINQDPAMITITLSATTELTDWYELIDILYLLPDFKDERTTRLLNDFREHQEYLVAYNATRAMKLPTEPVVKKFRKEQQ